MIPFNINHLFSSSEVVTSIANTKNYIQYWSFEVVTNIAGMNKEVLILLKGINPKVNWISKSITKISQFTLTTTQRGL